MNRKQLLIIIILGVVFGIVGLRFARQKSDSFERTEKTSAGKLLGDFPVNDVSFITIRQNTNEVHLVKGEVWKVKERGDYPANSGEIIELARKLWDLRAAQSQKIGESQLARLDLLTPDKAGTNSGTLVELKDKDAKLMRSVLLGKQSMRGGGGNDSFGGGGWPNGRWIYLPDKPGAAYVVSETFSEIEPNPAHWLNKDFFKVEKLKSAAVTFPEETNSWKVTRETESGEWKLADAKPEEKLDSAKTSGLNYTLNAPRFDDVRPANDFSAQAGLNKPTTVVLETFDGFAYTLKVGDKTGDTYPFTINVVANLPTDRTPGENEKLEDKDKLDKEFKEKQAKLQEKLKQESSLDKWTYLVSSWTVDSILKGRIQLLAESKKVEASDKTKTGEMPALDHPAVEN